MSTKKVTTLSLPKGFTLIEVLIVVSILAILVISTYFAIGRQRIKAEDARSKNDLERLKIAFEDYYNDKNCYPPPEWFDDASDCGSSNLNPYLSTIVCNKKTGLPYPVQTDDTGCKWYKVYGLLQNPSDPNLLSSPTTIGSYIYNYGVSSSGVSLGTTNGNSPLPPGHNYYYCSAANNCTDLPSNLICSPYYTDDPDCGGCPTVSSCHY